MIYKSPTEARLQTSNTSIKLVRGKEPAEYVKASLDHALLLETLQQQVTPEEFKN